MDRISPKTGPYPGLKALQVKPVEVKHNISIIYNSTATRRSTQLNGSHTRSTQSSVHQMNINTIKHTIKHTSNEYKYNQALYIKRDVVLTHNREKKWFIF